MSSWAHDRRQIQFVVWWPWLPCWRLWRDLADRLRWRRRSRRTSPASAALFEDNDVRVLRRPGRQGRPDHAGGRPGAGRHDHHRRRDAVAAGRRHKPR
ncbi:hypothetical protein HBB16_06960 [Pseudonocardia sp. MCCB 268]|nr:hypothetical protein [Pseudonocardia cytotoxica]